MNDRANKTVENIDVERFDNEAVTSEELVMIDFWAEWCGPCRTLSPLVETLATENDGHLKVYKVNVDDHPELAQRYAIRGIPTLLFLKAGKEQQRIVGVQPKEALQAHIDRLAAEHVT